MYQHSSARARPYSLPLISILAATFLLSGMNAGALVLEEVIVTAQKREQNLQDIGIAITALTGDQVRELGMSKSTMVADMAPNVILVQPNSRQSYGLSIRGVFQNDFADHHEHPTSIYVDEAYISQASGAGFQLFDLDRVEILRGPQGTLYGRNATGGAVSYFTKKPSQEFDAYIEGKYGSYNNHGFEGAVGGGITDRVSGRISATGNWHDPFAENRVGPDIFDDNSAAMRGQLLFEFKDDASLLINARYAYSELLDGGASTQGASFDPVTGFGFVRGENEVTSNPLATSIDCPGCDYLGFNEPDDDPFTLGHDQIGFADLHTAGVGVRLEWGFENFDFVSITDWSHIEKEYLEDTDNTPIPATETFLANNVEQFSHRRSVSAGRRSTFAGSPEVTTFESVAIMA